MFDGDQSYHYIQLNLRNCSTGEILNSEYSGKVCPKCYEALRDVIIEDDEVTACL